MPNWTESMQQTFEYYLVDPNTWKDRTILKNVKSCTIQRDLEVDTLGSATFDIVDFVGECYIRVYLVTIQNGLTERFPLGTFLVQTPSSSYDGKIRSVSMDAYTPLLELKENPPPIGYFIPKNANIMERVGQLVADQVRAPVAPTENNETLYYDFVASNDDTWMSFTTDLMANAKYSFELDEMGRILFSPKQDLASLQPVWTYDDGNSSILYPELTLDHDIYNIPNVVKVIHSTGGDVREVVVTNDDPNSPISTVNRGRTITRRTVNPDLVSDNPTDSQIEEYAKQQLEELSTVVNTISYSHGYCPVKLGDCVRLNYSRANLQNIKAKVIRQSIKCEPGCPVQETAIYPNKLWG